MRNVCVKISKYYSAAAPVMFFDKNYVEPIFLHQIVVKFVV